MTLYDDDILLWSERQADLLRRHAAGERINSVELDWPNIIEEIESVGNEQLHAVNSNLMQALIHMLKAKAWPFWRDVPHWESQARVFRANAADRFVPSMRQRIDLTRRPYARCRRRSTASRIPGSERIDSPVSWPGLARPPTTLLSPARKPWVTGLRQP